MTRYRWWTLGVFFLVFTAFTVGSIVTIPAQEEKPPLREAVEKQTDVSRWSLVFNVATLVAVFGGLLTFGMTVGRDRQRLVTVEADIKRLLDDSNAISPETVRTLKDAADKEHERLWAGLKALVERLDHLADRRE